MTEFRKAITKRHHPRGLLQPDLLHSVAAFLKDAKAASVDGLIVVDLPPEEDEELCTRAQAGLNFIHPGDADDRRQAPAHRAAPRRASSTTSRLPASPARARPPTPRFGRGALEAPPTCRSPSASASTPRSRRRRSQRSRTPPSSDRRWSTGSARRSAPTAQPRPRQSQIPWRWCASFRPVSAARGNDRVRLDSGRELRP